MGNLTSSVDTSNSGINSANANLALDHITKSGPAAVVALASVALYFIGIVIPCLSCGSVRTIILAFIAFVATYITNILKAQKECKNKSIKNLAFDVLEITLYPTIAFIIGYVILPYGLPGMFRMLTWVGPGKTAIPGVIGSLSMIACNYIVSNYVKTDFCKEVKK